MLLKLSKNKREIHWTRHIKEKMREYQLSEKRLLKIFRNPERKEEGIVPGTVAVMQTAGRRHPYEIWLMYQIKISKVKSQNSKLKRIIMISTWKYPGKSKIRKPPIPEELLDNLDSILKE
jgi:hypothetical protein